MWNYLSFLKVISQYDAQDVVLFFYHYDFVVMAGRTFMATGFSDESVIRYTVLESELYNVDCSERGGSITRVLADETGTRCRPEERSSGRL